MPTSTKTMTLEKLAETINGGFETAAEHLAGVKRDLAELNEESAAVKQELKGDIAALRSEMNSEFADLRRAHNYGPELDELRERVKELEKKAGVNKLPAIDRGSGPTFSSLIRGVPIRRLFSHVPRRVAPKLQRGASGYNQRNRATADSPIETPILQSRSMKVD